MLAKAKTKQKKPIWFYAILVASGHTLVYWPLFFTASVFLVAANPGAGSAEEAKYTASLFIGYPLPVIALMTGGFLLFSINRAAGSLLSAVPFIVFLFLFNTQKPMDLDGPFWNGPLHKVENGTVRCNKKALKDVDVASFVSLGRIFGKDKFRVYYCDDVVQGADPNTFVTLTDNVGRDKAAIYHTTKTCPECDLATFRALTKGWYIDENAAYKVFLSQLRRIDSADVETFEVLNRVFARDKFQAYADYSPIVGADATTFTLRDGPCAVCAEDKHACYVNDKKVACDE